MVRFIYSKLRLLYGRAADSGKKAIWNIRANRLYFTTLLLKRCYYGPFTGEFGHLLGHNLPFIAHLHSKGVKVDFCGMEIHRPFFADENGNEIVSSYLPLRDFFGESAPDCNKADEPEDINTVTARFVNKAKKSFLPYWNNEDHHYYFYFFRWWVLKHHYTKVYNLSRIYKTEEINSVVIFPRKLNEKYDIPSQLKNNGLEWDYHEVARIASRHFEKVYVIGHPVFSSVDFGSFDNVEVCLTNDNRVILEKCCNSKLIVSQHSGSVYLGDYTDCPTLIIYNGGKEIGDIET